MLAYIISSISLFGVAIILLLRANDLRIQKRNMHWKVRMFGFVIAGTAPWAIMCLDRSPTVYEAAFRFGLLLVFSTTPHLPPLWRFLWHGSDGDVA